MAEIDDRIAEVAGHYQAHIHTLERGIRTARRILDNPEQIRKLAEFRIAHAADVYDWEMEDDPPADAPSSLWAGSTIYTATGEGMTQSCFVTWARSDAEFRRSFSLYVGRYLAHAARVGAVHDANEDGMSLFSSGIRGLIQDIVDGREVAPGFVCFTQLHRNLS